MNAHITLDTSGRVLIPETFRDRLGLGPGDMLELSEASDLITLKPVRQTTPLEKRHGFWVYTGQAQTGESAETLIADDREVRADALLNVIAPDKQKSGESVL